MNIASDGDALAALHALLESPSIASKAWIYQQYDSSVQTNTAAGPGSDAAVLRLADTDRGIAASLDGNGRYVYLEPRTGARIAVCEAARNVACSGARPVAITNCLNFGNPLGPAVYYQLSEAVAGMGEACRALQTPVSGGNVSLYNETPSGPIYPTPVIGMVGVLESMADRVPYAFSRPGDRVLLIGNTRDEIGGSEYLAVVHRLVAGSPPSMDAEEAARLVDFLVAGAEARLFRSAHDCADGGLAVALAEAALGAPGGPLGLEADLTTDCSHAGALFGESQNRVVVSVDPDRVDAVRELAASLTLPVAALGVVGGRAETWKVSASGRTIEASVEELRRVFEGALPRRMEHEAGLAT